MTSKEEEGGTQKHAEGRPGEDTETPFSSIISTSAYLSLVRSGATLCGDKEHPSGFKGQNPFLTLWSTEVGWQAQITAVAQVAEGAGTAPPGARREPESGARAGERGTNPSATCWSQRVTSSTLHEWARSASLARQKARCWGHLQTSTNVPTFIVYNRLVYFCLLITVFSKE